MKNLRIECPKCQWKPHANSRWVCTCGHVWHTFETGGRCPRCHKQWEDTSCTSKWEGGCEQWSKHLDWYVDLDDLLLQAMHEVWREKLQSV